MSALPLEEAADRRAKEKERLDYRRVSLRFHLLVRKLHAYAAFDEIDDAVYVDMVQN